MAAILFVVYAVLTSMFLQTNGQNTTTSKPGTTTCPTNVTSFCTSCKTQGICPSSGAMYTNSSCINNQVCQFNNATKVAICADASKVNECKCNSTSGIAYQCDPYDPKRRITCFNGALQSSLIFCTGTTICSSGKCVDPPPITTQAPTTSTTTPLLTTCAPDSEPIIKENCTSFYFCNPNEFPNTFECNYGQIFSAKVQNCINYTSSFSCPSDTGVFSDPFNCTLVHTCTNGVDSISQCPPNQYFNEENRTCTDNGSGNDTACVAEQCVPCRSDADLFAVDSTKCIKDYKQCTAGGTEASDNLTLLVKQCPGPFNFDPVKLACSKTCSIPKESLHSLWLKR